MTESTNGNVVELHGISKSYGETRANVDIDFDLRAGEIHVLLGENGAGKTTLMNVMFGHVLPDAGTVHVRGTQADIHSPHDALELGIGMVHQHFSLVPTFSVAENIVLGSRPATDLRFRRGAIGAETTELAEKFGMPLDPHVAVGDLPVDLQQRVEILKVLYRGATILILDEPTSLLGPRQIENLLEILRDLRERGCSIVLVTHKLGEVMEVADRVTVLRGGLKVTTTERGDFDERSLTRAMTGHEIAAVESDHAPWTDDVPLLEVSELNAPGEGADHLDSMSFMVRPGEILGVAGVEGNGQRTLVNCVCGLDEAESGTVRIGGQDVTGSGTTALRSAGLAVIPEDRHSWGLILDMSVAENIAMSDIPAGAYNKRGLLDWRSVRRRSRELLEEYDVRPPDPDLLASSLSGGNQQKVVLARELSREPRVLVADNPTWGLDVGAIDYVHRRLLDVKHSGAAVLLLSMDLEELLKLSDRLIVLFRGRIVLEGSIADLDMDELALAMAGRTVPAAV